MRVTAGIATFRREAVLIDTLWALIRLPSPADEIVVVDQTPYHEPATVEALERLSAENSIRWIIQKEPSIPMSMNRILLEARGNRVLFVDDDIVPGESLVRAHRATGIVGERTIVAGQVLQPGEEASALGPGESFRFSSTEPRSVEEFIGCNFSVDRKFAIGIGGFDENFEGAAYRFERDFGDRAIDAGGGIVFDPIASIRHLRAPSGGTRAGGSHLMSASPAHSVGEYYYLLRSGRIRRRWKEIARRLIRSISTRHHLRQPWWIPVTLTAEIRGVVRAMALRRRGPQLIERRCS